MDAIKFHAGNLSDDGTQNCDYRNPDGTERIGAAEGDHHRTIFEIDPATPEQVALVLEHGPKLNQLLKEVNPVGDILGMHPGLRVGVWPGDGRA